MPTQWIIANKEKNDELATDENGRYVLAWNHAANARNAARKMAGKWTTIKSNSLRARAAMKQQFGHENPRHVFQDSRD